MLNWGWTSHQHVSVVWTLCFCSAGADRFLQHQNLSCTSVWNKTWTRNQRVHTSLYPSRAQTDGDMCTLDSVKWRKWKWTRASGEQRGETTAQVLQLSRPSTCFLIVFFLEHFPLCCPVSPATSSPPLPTGPMNPGTPMRRGCKQPLSIKNSRAGLEGSQSTPALPTPPFHTLDWCARRPSTGSFVVAAC